MKPCAMCGLKFIHKANCKFGPTKSIPTTATTITAGSKQQKTKKTSAPIESKRRTHATTAPPPMPNTLLMVQPNQTTVDLTSPIHMSAVAYDGTTNRPSQTNNELMLSSAMAATAAMNQLASVDGHRIENPTDRPSESGSENDSNSDDDNHSNSGTENNENRPLDVDGNKSNSLQRTVKPLRLSLVDHKNNIAAKRNVSHAIITPTIVHSGKNMNMLVNQETSSEQCYRTINGNDDSDNGNDHENEHGSDNNNKQRVLIPHYVRDESTENELGREQMPLLVPKLKLKISREFQAPIESEESSTESDDDDDADADNVNNDDSSVTEENTSISLVENSMVENVPHTAEAPSQQDEMQSLNQFEHLPVAQSPSPTADIENVNATTFAHSLGSDDIVGSDPTESDVTMNTNIETSPKIVNEIEMTPAESGVADETPMETTEQDVSPVIVDDDVPIEPVEDTRPITEFILDQPLDQIPIKKFVRKCVESTFLQCLYCNHAREIAVNGRMLAMHLMMEHRFSATVDSITAEELLPDTIEQKINNGLSDLDGSYFNMITYDNGAPNDDYIFFKKFECFQCRFTSSIYKDLYLHNRKMHLRAALICHMCHCNFFSYSELVCHMCPGASSLMIPIDIKFRCVLCNLDDIPSAFRLMVHLRKKHSACDVCLEECFDPSRLSCHVWKHKLHHLCYRCNITYRNKADITRHLFWKHGTESVMCKRCLEKKWPHVYHFCVPPATFVCDVCSSTFSKAVALKVHKRVHASEDSEHSYECTETSDCNKKFISRKLLEKHVSRHYMPALPPWPLPPYVPEKYKDEEADDYYDDEAEQNNGNRYAILTSETLPIHVESAQLPAPTITLDEEVNAEAREEVIPSDNSTMPIKANVEAISAKPEIISDAAATLIKGDQSATVEQKAKKKFKKNKSDLSDILDLPTLNLSESDSSDDSDNENSLPPNNLAASNENSIHSFSDVVSQLPEGDVEIVVDADDEDEAKNVAPIVDIWDNFKSYQASQMQDKILDDIEDDKLYAEQPAILHVSQSDHDYCMMYKPIAKRVTVEPKQSTVAPIIETNEKGEIQVSFTDIPIVPVSEAESEHILSSTNRNDVVDNVENVGEITIDEKTSGDTADTDSVTDSQKKAAERKRRASESSSGDSSDSSSSCSCGSNCSCSSSSSGSSSSSSDSDSDSSSSEGRRRKKQLKAGKSPAKAHSTVKELTAAEETSLKTNPPDVEKNDEMAAIKDEQQLNVDALTAQEAIDDTKHDGDLVDVVTTDAKFPPNPDPDTIIVESDLETTESETDEDFYDDHPQKLANQLLAEKRKQLMLQTYNMSEVDAAAMAGISRSTTPLLPAEREQKVKVKKRKRDRRNLKGSETSPQKNVSAISTPTATLLLPNASIDPNGLAAASPISSQPPPPPPPTLTQMTIPPITPLINPINSVTAIGPPPSTLTTPNNIRLSTSSCSDADSSLKRSKRRRIPNKFYGYTSDDDSTTSLLPKAPPVLVWNKEDLPSKPTKNAKLSKPTKKVQRQSLPPPPSLKTIIRFGSDGKASRAITSKTPKNHRKMSLTPNVRKRTQKAANKSKVATDTPPTVPKLIIRPFGGVPQSTPKPSLFDHQHQQQQTLPPPHALNELLRVPAVPIHHISAPQIPLNPDQSSEDSDSDSDSSSDNHMKIVQPSTHQPTIIKNSNQHIQWTGQNRQQSQPPAANIAMPFQQIHQQVLPPNNQQQSLTVQPSQNAVPMFNNQLLNPALINQPNQIRYPIVPPVGCRSQARDGESVYCYCRCPYDEVTEMIACDATNCPIEWFHFECVGIVVAPQDKWYCPQCRPHYNTNAMAPIQSSSVINHFVGANQLQQISSDRLVPTLHQYQPNEVTSPSIT